MALDLQQSDECPMKIDPSGTPWTFRKYGDHRTKMVTMCAHDGTELGHFIGPHAQDNALHLGSMLRVCDGMSPEWLHEMRLTLRDFYLAATMCSQCSAALNLGEPSESQPQAEAPAHA